MSRQYELSSQAPTCRLTLRRGRVAVLLPIVLLAAVAMVAGGCGDVAMAETDPQAATSTSLDSTTTLPLPPSPAELILAGMTLQEKASQVLWVAFAGKSMSSGTGKKLIQQGPVGGLILLPANVGGPKTMRALTEGIQEQAQATGSPLQVFVGADQEGGVTSITTGMPRVPWARVLGEESTPQQAGELAADTARGLLDLGINLNLAPVADVAPKDSYIGRRSYGGDAALVASFVSAIVEQYESNGLVSVAKHFPGHGSVEGNSHEGKVVASATKETFETVHLPPFQEAIAAGVDGVMLSHITAAAYDPDNPASRSPALISMLRDEWGFDGLIVTDSVCMMSAQLNVGVEGAAVASLKAGCDAIIVMATAGKELSVRDEIVRAVQDGRLRQERLDEAVLRLIEVKLEHGLVF